MLKLNIEYFSKGGNFPYQAEGKINDDYFYFRARHNVVSLHIYESMQDLNNKDNTVESIFSDENSYLNDEEADSIIRKLYYRYVKTNRG